MNRNEEASPEDMFLVAGFERGSHRLFCSDNHLHAGFRARKWNLLSLWDLVEDVFSGSTSPAVSKSAS